MTTPPTVREQLLAGGTEHVRARGTAELTVRALATASGRTTMCVYTKFGNRTQYLAAIFDALADELLTALDRSSPAELLASLRRWGRENAGAWDLLMRAPVEIIDIEPSRRARLLGGLDRAMGEAGAAPEARRGILLATAYGLMAQEGLGTSDPAAPGAGLDAQWAELLASAAA